MRTAAQLNRTAAIVIVSLLQTRIRGSGIFFVIIIWADTRQVRVGIGEIAVAYYPIVSGGRYLTHDPVRSSANPYSYAAWSPTNQVDVNGEFPWLLVILAVAAASAIDAGIRTGSVSEAFKAFAISGAIAVATAGTVSVGLAVVKTAVTEATYATTVATLKVAGVAAGGYGTYQAANHGMYATAAVAAALTAFGAYDLLSAQETNGAGRGGGGNQYAAGNDSLSDAGNDVRLNTPSAQAASGGFSGAVGRVAGAIWNLPNTVLGTAYGILGIPAGGIGFEHGQLQFKGNLLQWLLSAGGRGAVTLGDAGVYPPGFGPETLRPFSGLTLGFEESFHSLQGRLLGPLYLPAHLTFGSAALALHQDWHLSLLELGPHASPPRVF